MKEKSTYDDKKREVNELGGYYQINLRMKYRVYVAFKKLCLDEGTNITHKLNTMIKKEIEKSGKER